MNWKEFFERNKIILTIITLIIIILIFINYWIFNCCDQPLDDIYIRKCRTKFHTYCSNWLLTEYATEDVNGVETPTIGWFVDENPKCVAFAQEIGFSPENNVVIDKTACESTLGPLASA